MTKQLKSHSAQALCSCGHAASISGKVEHAGQLTVALLKICCPLHVAGVKGHHLHMTYDLKSNDGSVGIQLAMFDGAGNVHTGGAQ